MNDAIELERTKLGFKEAVREHFKFLSEFGFREVQALTTIVRYRSRNLELCVYHGRISYEIGVEIYQSDERFTIAELIRLSDPHTHEKYRSPMVSSSSSVLDSAVERLANLLRRFGEKALRNDAAVFAALRKQGFELTESWPLTFWNRKLDLWPPKLSGSVDTGMRNNCTTRLQRD